MKKITTTALLLASFFVFAQQKKKANTTTYTTKDKTIQVYTTAENTENRLTITENLNFTPARQPVETEIAVFVEPNITFQNFMGIGGAITDASAEVFAKLSKEKQQELLDAYYTSDRGIGYSLLRTTIHSSDFEVEVTPISKKETKS